MKRLSIGLSVMGLGVGIALGVPVWRGPLTAQRDEACERADLFAAAVAAIAREVDVDGELGLGKDLGFVPAGQGTLRWSEFHAVKAGTGDIEELRVSLARTMQATKELRQERDDFADRLEETLIRVSCATGLHKRPAAPAALVPRARRALYHHVQERVLDRARELAARDAAMAETLIACRTLLECQVVGDERSVATEHSLAETTARLTALRHRSRDNAQAFREIVAGIYGRRCRQLAAQQGDRPPSSSELADVLAELATMNGRLLAERETVRQLAEEREARAELVEELEERKDEADHFRATIRRLLTRKPIPNDVPETEPKGPRDTPRM